MTDELRTSYTYESVFFFFLMEVVQNIEKRYWADIPDKKQTCRIKLRAMIDDTFFARAMFYPKTPAEHYLSPYVKDCMLLYGGLFNDHILREMASKLKQAYDSEKANGTLAVFHTQPQASFSNEWDDVYKAYT